MICKKLPDQNILHEFLNYDPSTGELRWKKRDRKWFNSDREYKYFNNRFSGEIAGSKNRVLIRWNGDRLNISRVIYKWMTNTEPQNVTFNDLDVKNLKWSNLTEYNDISKMRHYHYSCNRRNRSGCIGVIWNKVNKKWISNFGLNNKLIHLGSYNDYKDAVKAREEAEKDYKSNNLED